VRHRSWKAWGALGAATAVIATSIAVISAAPAAQAALARGFEIAFQTSVGHLGTLGPDGTATESKKAPDLAPGSSPGITASPGLRYGFQVGLRIQDGRLALCDAIGCAFDVNTVTAGTNPSINLTPTGGGATVTYFVSAPFGLMRKVNRGSAIAVGVQLAPNSSPAAAWNSSGTLNKVAVVGTDGFLRQSTNGSAFGFEAVNVFVAAGTSPAVAVGPLDAMVAVNSAGGDLLLNRWSDRTANDTGLAIRAGSSPSIAVMSTGGFLTAYVAPDGTLNVVGPTGTNFPLGQKVAANSNPAIASDEQSGDWKIAYSDAETGLLSTFDYTAANNSSHVFHSSAAVAAGTSPSIAFVTLS
jgi:hypothetical protein